ncbi:MAG: ABC transporter permease [Pseudomonadota bacterium]
MSWLRLALANLRLSPLTSAVNVLLMALGTASIVLLLLVGTQLSDTMSKNARGVDLVLGAQGSPVQLVLATVYHADAAPGNIALADARPWMEDRRVDQAIPMSLGDSYTGFRIVGTLPEFADLYAANLADGRWWSDSLEAVIGAAVADATGLGVGDTFESAHGLVEGGHQHADEDYRITGVLERTGTVADRLILTSLESIWAVHGSGHQNHEHEEKHDDDHQDHDEHDHDDDDRHDGEHADDHDDHDEHDHDEEHADNHEDHDGHEHDEHDHDKEHADEHDENHAKHDDDHEDHDGHDHGDDGEHDDEHAADHDDHDAQHADDHEDHDGHDHGDDDEHASGDAAYDINTLRYDEEVTAVLLTFRSPTAAVSLPRQINAGGSVLAASPVTEVTRLLGLIGVGLDGLRTFAWLLIISAGLSIFAALYGSLRSRRGDIAMLRCLGATRSEVLVALLLEGLLLTALGVVLGFLAGHVTVELLGAWLESARGVSFTGVIWLSAETWLLLSLLIVGIIAALVPAVQAYRTDVAKTLAEAP